MRLPSKHEAFIEDKAEWISDKFFTQQRLAGPNPMSIKRVIIPGTGKNSHYHHHHHHHHHQLFLLFQLIQLVTLFILILIPAISNTKTKS